MNLVFCNGQPKSGSTFCFNLVKRLLPHEKFQATNNMLHHVIERNDAVRKMLYLELGTYTGFVNGSIAEAARAFATLSLTDDRRLIVKVHDPEPPPAPGLPGENMIITTFRDPLDVMMALRDQADRERLRPPGLIRPAFLAVDSHAKALARAERFLAGLVRSFSPDNWYLEYPGFICPAPEQAIVLGAILGVDAKQIIETAALLDREIKAGMVAAEFNRGEAGRGREIIGDLMRDGRVPRRLVELALARYRELVDLVARHRRGIVARH